MKTFSLRQIIARIAVTASVLGLALPAQAETPSSALITTQWIEQSGDGSISGKLVVPRLAGAAEAVADATVGLVSEQRAIYTTRTDEQGGFSFEGIEPGVYTLISRGANNVCSVVALHVLPAGDQTIELPQELEIAAAQLDYASVNMMMIRYLPPTTAPAASAEVKWEAVADKVSRRNMHRVVQRDGGLRGQVYRAGSDWLPSGPINVFLYRNSEEIHRVVSDEQGQFEIAALEPGIYSALFVGSSGMGLVGFELVAPSDPRVAANSENETFITAQDSPIATQLVMQVAPGGPAADGLQAIAPSEATGDVVVDETVAGDGVVGTGAAGPVGGGGGGFAGGAGGGIGGGGAGGLLSIGGLAAGVAALAADDDDREPPVATPASL